MMKKTEKLPQEVGLSDFSPRPLRRLIRVKQEGSVSPEKVLQQLQKLLRVYELQNVLKLTILAQEKNDEEDRRQIAARGRAQ
jgi:hypothetical protein